MNPNVELEIASDHWAVLDDAETLARDAIGLACSVTRISIREGAEVSVLLTDDAGISALNARWRSQAKPTNVLSFPSAAPGRIADALLLGDIVIAFETMRREAEADGKSLADHYRHLVVHGFLHLIGFDHLDPDEADSMEGLERAILAGLSIDDPYALTAPLDD
jgi:probable rRNA maturation factor